jgi:hypothetical protein
VSGQEGTRQLGEVQELRRQARFQPSRAGLGAIDLGLLRLASAGVMLFLAVAGDGRCCWTRD